MQKWQLLELNWRASQGQDILEELQDGELEAAVISSEEKKKTQTINV